MWKKLFISPQDPPYLLSRSDESLFFFFDLLSLGKPLMETLVVIPPCVTVRRSLD